MWLELIENPQIIRSIFKDESPSLKEVKLKKIELYDNGPIVNLDLDLKDFPVYPPQKWLLNNFNAVHVKISLEVIESIEIKHWTNSNNVSISIVNNKQTKEVQVEGECKAKFVCRWIRVVDIKGYSDERSDKIM